MKQPYHVGAAVAAFVFNNKGKTLIQLRTGSHGAHTWHPPGGKLDFGETPLEGIVREVKEETDLAITNLEYIGYTNDIFEADELHYVTLWYASFSGTGTAKNTEPEKCLDLKWCDLDAIPDPLFTPTRDIMNDEVAMTLLRDYKEKITS